MTQNYEQGQEEDFYQDAGFVPPELLAHSELLPTGGEFAAEPMTAPVRFEPLGLIGRAVIGYNKHRKGVKQLSIGTGFIVGGAVAVHRHSHA